MNLYTLQSLVLYHSPLEASLWSMQADVDATAKFQVLSQILQLGYAALLSDMDVVTIQNPFGHLRRDADLEAASDGFSNATAYGTHWPISSSTSHPLLYWAPVISLLTLNFC